MFINEPMTLENIVPSEEQRHKNRKTASKIGFDTFIHPIQEKQTTAMMTI